MFGAAGIPSVLDWHFTDRYYHTNFDTPDKTSPAEMKNVEWPWRLPPGSSRRPRNPWRSTWRSGRLSG